MNECIIKYETTSKIQSVISKIGRTEDVKFSPDNKRFAITELYEKSIHLFSFEIDSIGCSPKIRITNYTLLKSKSFNHPHGLCFLDNNHIVVCNRKGGISIVKIPPADDKTQEHNVVPVSNISGKGLLFSKVKSPGSVDCYEISRNCYKIFVCNNFWHTVTSHTIETGSLNQIKNEGVLIENGIKIPDGISLSPDRKWIAISNHVDGNVLIYRYSPQLNRNTPPSVVLSGPVCPHGIRFTPDGKKLFIADAATPYIHLYECDNGNWSDYKKDVKSIRILNDEIFYRGRYGAKEGGLKGIDIDNSNSLLITTHKDQIIRFYELNKLYERKNEFDLQETKEFCRERDKSFVKDKTYDPNKKWTFRSSLRGSLKNIFLRSLNIAKRTRIKKDLFYLDIRSKFSNESLLDPSGPVVSLTTHGFRLNTVYYSIESIGRGLRKPSRIILWLNDESKCLNPPQSLKRLIRRGLEIYCSENYGPHTKYYPYIISKNEINKPLVTADDDVLYPENWLNKLIEANKTSPSIIHCYAARKMSLNNMRFLPFGEWKPCGDTIPNYNNLILGVSGVIYPPVFLEYLKDKGDVFQNYCAENDDIWLTVSALRAGFKIAQIQNKPIHYKNIPGTQKKRLMDYNEALGGNQIQLIQTFTNEDLKKLDSNINSEE